MQESTLKSSVKFDHYYDDRLYLLEIMVLEDQDFTRIIKIPYYHESTWGNGDYGLSVFFNNYEQMKMFYKYRQHKLRVSPYRLEEEFKKINDYKIAKYLAEKLYRFYLNVESNINGKPLELF